MNYNDIFLLRKEKEVRYMCLGVAIKGKAQYEAGKILD